MKKLLVALSALAISTVAASAADLAPRYTKAPPPPPPPPCIWCGFYIGLNGGWVGNQGTNSLVATSFDDGFLDTGPIGSNNNQNTNGGFGGGQIGYNWAWPGQSWLVGVEADIQGASLHGNAATVSFLDDEDNPVTATADSRLNWFGTLRGRLGFLPTQTVLLYGTAGFAFGGVKNNLLATFEEFNDPCGPCSAATLVTNNSTRTGWVAGAGIEWMFAPNWSLKGEYQYISLGSINQVANAFITEFEPGAVTGTGVTAVRHVNENFNTVRVGVNYHFGGYGGPAYGHY